MRGRTENGAKSASGSSTPPTNGTTKTNRLMTRFRVPLSGRLRGGGDHHRKGRGGPSKEDREVMDTGRIKRWREKREQVRTMMLYLVSCITYLSTDSLRLIFISSIHHRSFIK